MPSQYNEVEGFRVGPGRLFSSIIDQVSDPITGADNLFYNGVSVSGLAQTIMFAD